ncbi:MAG: hypothetical protein Kilf2KO_37180 [Rhodospirillales bacterium]
MREARANPLSTLELETKVETEFVAPLTALRGSLELLRDVPDLSEEDRQRFLDTALRGCTRLEQAVKELGDAVYAAGHKVKEQGKSVAPEDYKRYAERIKILHDSDTIEIDFSEFRFSSNQIVNDFYDVVEDVIEASGRKWYFLVNYSNCSIWPEAWVAFAHRGKKVNVNYSLATIRYSEPNPGEDVSSEPDSFDPDLLPSRQLALSKLEEIKAAATG